MPTATAAQTTVNRADFLQVLEALKPGLSPGKKQSIEQSNCFVFKNSKAYAFNDEVAVRGPSGLPKEWSCAVGAEKLLEVVRRTKAEEIGVTLDGKELGVRAGGRSVYLLLDPEGVKLPLGLVGKAGEWITLKPAFLDAVGVVSATAGTDEKNAFLFTLVHVTPTHLEASDTVSFVRYRVKTGLGKPVLVRHGSVKHTVGLGVTEMSTSDGWLHFRNPSGVVLSCRTFDHEFPDCAHLMEGSGEPTVLPHKLADAAELAGLFSKENQGEGGDDIRVQLTPGRAVVEGIGVTGRSRERLQVDYSGKPVSFTVRPGMLSELVNRHNEVEVSADRIYVNGGRWRFVTSVGSPEAPANGEK